VSLDFGGSWFTQFPVRQFEATPDSLTLLRGESFFVEPRRARLTVEELLRAHVAKPAQGQTWEVPQADAFWRVAEFPMLVEQGINTSAKVAEHYEFDPRQSSYYRQAAEFLGLVYSEKGTYRLTDLGREYTTRTADERRQLLAGILAEFPPMRALLELSAKAGTRGIGRSEITALISRHSTIGKSTPNRRAVTLSCWLRWLQAATGAVKEKQERFVLN
ncbi:MAG: AAA-associated domain-containing protein, partial [Verrucomicrobiota bacterium]